MNPATTLPVDLVDPHPYNPRRDLGDLTELVTSITAHGVRQNLLVVPQNTCACNPRETAHWTPPLDDGGPLDDRCAACAAPRRFTTVIGHRRLAAARLASLAAVPAVVDGHLDSAGQLELMLLENLQRVDLTPIEEAKGYQDLLDLGMTTDHIVKTTGRSKTTVTGRLKLLKMAPAAQEAVHAGQATLEDAAALQWVTEHAGKRQAKLVEKATTAIGTQNFDWELKNARQAIERALAKTEREDVVAAAGLKFIKSTDGYQYVQHVWQTDRDEILATLKPYAKKKGYALHADQWNGMTLYRELSTSETVAKVKEKRAAQLRDEIVERASSDFETAWELRDEFVRRLLGRKKLTTAETNTILDHVVPDIVCDYAGTASLFKWATGEAFPGWCSAGEAVSALTRVYPDAPAVALLVLPLHLAGRNSTWSPGRIPDHLRRCYKLLEALGYQASDTERTYLDAPAYCNECDHPTDDHDVDNGTCYGHGHCPCAANDEDEDGA